LSVPGEVVNAVADDGAAFVFDSVVLAVVVGIVGVVESDGKRSEISCNSSLILSASSEKSISSPSSVSVSGSG